MGFWNRIVLRVRFRRGGASASDAEAARRRRIAALTAVRRLHEPPAPLDPFSDVPVRNRPSRPSLPNLAIALPEPHNDRAYVEAVGAARR
jgi:hypothetical protein